MTTKSNGFRRTAAAELREIRLNMVQIEFVPSEEEQFYTGIC